MDLEGTHFFILSKGTMAILKMLVLIRIGHFMNIYEHFMSSAQNHLKEAGLRLQRLGVSTGFSGAQLTMGQSSKLLPQTDWLCPALGRAKEWGGQVRDFTRR